MKNDDSIIIIGGLLTGVALLAFSNSASGESDSSTTTAGLTSGAIDTANDGVNNPLDIRVSSTAWQGKNTAPGKKFESFANMWQGYRAGLVNLRTIFNKGNTTLTQMIGVYAPASDSNDVANYVSGLANAAGIDPLNDDMTALISDGPTMQKIITYMARLEQGSSFSINPNDVVMAWNNI